MPAINDAAPWTELTGGSEITSMMKRFGGFHDACIREIHVVTGHFVGSDLSMHVDWRTRVHMVVQRQYLNPSAIELRFEELLGLQVAAPEPNCESIIFEAKCFIQDGILYWSDSASWDPASPDPHRCTWVASRRAYWREASDWIGPELHYGSIGQNSARGS